jgi:PAS domain S-box-containing protein
MLDVSIYLQLSEHALDAAFLTRPDGTILFANPAACKQFGYTLDEFRTLGRSAIVDQSDPRLQAALNQRYETGRFQGVLKLRRKDGSRFSAAVSSAVYTDSSGEQRTSMFVRDLTEQEQREEALSRALAEVHQLRGMLPICSYCKSIRNDANFWQQVETYISAHAPVRFTHGICPECYEHHVRPELEKLERKAN